MPGQRGVKPQQLLRTNIRYLFTTHPRDRPSNRITPKTRAVIEYAKTNSLLDPHASAAAASLRGTAAQLVRVVAVGSHARPRGPPAAIPRTIYETLLNSARENTNQAMARAFFRNLKQRGEVALKEVGLPTSEGPSPPPPPPPVDAREDKPDPPAVSQMDAMRASMAARADWDASSESAGSEKKKSRSGSKSRSRSRGSRRKVKSRSRSKSKGSSEARRRRARKTRRKKSLARWIKRREEERQKARKAAGQ